MILALILSAGAVAPLGFVLFAVWRGWLISRGKRWGDDEPSSGIWWKA